MIAKTNGLVLRHMPFSESSRLVTWLTPDFGKTTTLAKGAMRRKSFFLGRIDLFYTCEVLFYYREGRELNILRECDPLKQRQRFRSDWRAASAASYCCGLILRTLQHHNPQPEIHHLLDNLLDDLESAGMRWALLFWFELRLLSELGLAPKLDGCLACSAVCAKGRPALFSARRGGLLCRACAASDAGDLLRLEPDSLASLRAWQRAATSHAALATRNSPPQIRAINQTLASFITRHLDTPSACREALVQTVGSSRG